LPFLVTAAVFGFAHNEWLAGILCGAAYQWLVIRKHRLGDAMTAHAITNFLLGLWIVWRGARHFWGNFGGGGAVTHARSACSENDPCLIYDGHRPPLQLTSLRC